MGGAAGAAMSERIRLRTLEQAEHLVGVLKRNGVDAFARREEGVFMRDNLENYVEFYTVVVR